MSKPKTNLIAELGGEVRAFQTAVDAFDECAADRLAVNRTDLRCLDILGARDPMTAGQVADQMRMTTGAVTVMLDRLEQRGLARRTRDDRDRRRVYVQLTPDAKRLISAVYDDLILDEALRRASRYTIGELATVVRFLRDSRDLYEQALTDLAGRRDPEGPRSA